MPFIIERRIVSYGRDGNIVPHPAAYISLVIIVRCNWNKIRKVAPQTLLLVSEKLVEFKQGSCRRKDHQRVGVCAAIPCRMGAAEINTTDFLPEQFKSQRERADLAFDAVDGSRYIRLRARKNLCRTLELKAAISQAFHEAADRIANGVDAILETHHGRRSPPDRNVSRRHHRAIIVRARQDERDDEAGDEEQ